MYKQSGNLSIKTIGLLLVLFILGAGCKPTRLLTNDQYLLKSNRLSVDTKDVDKKELQSYYRQKPNRRTFFVLYIHLSAYNFSKLGKERDWKNWLGRVVGEEPAILDSTLIIRTNEQFARFMQNQSYYNVKVENSIKYRRHRAWVYYKIISGSPMLINDVEFQIKDSTIAPLINADTNKCLLKPGNKLLKETLVNESNRISNNLRDKGYYKFSSDYVRYAIDSSNNKASITIEVQKALEVGVGSKVRRVPHKKYQVGDIYIYPDFDPQKSIRNSREYSSTFDTIDAGGYKFIYSGKPNIKTKTIIKATQLEPDSKYNQSVVSKTNQHVTSLRLFRLNSTVFQESKENDTLLTCHMRLTPYTYQNYSVNLETTTTQGNIGFGGYVNYQHKNLFKGAEIFNFKVSGSVERQSATSEWSARNIFELGAEAKLETPSFILPIKLERFYRQYYPKTVFSLAFSVRSKPGQYKRNLISASMGYNWSGNESIRHFFYPFDLSSVTIPEMTEAFRDTIEGTYLENNYKDYFIGGSRYVLTINNSDKNSYQNHSFFRWNVEAAGNIIHFMNKTLNIGDTVSGGYYTILNTQYAQFIKTDFDYRYYNFLTQRNMFVVRCFAGFGIPYGNANAIPFVKQYSSGGAEGMRAWLARDLGPGTYVDSTSSYPDQYADIKLECNFEYRYDITKTLKGAYFIDIGNIWTYSSEDERSGGMFKFNQFYKQLAMGTGLGVRYDFGFTVIRLDAGLKVRDPAISGSETWVLFHQPLRLNSFILNFGIGYPF